MTAIEQLIRKKLATALDEEKRRVAASLMLDEAETSTAQKKSNKQAQITAMQQKITQLQGKVSTAKDPQAMAQKLAMWKEKLKVLQDEAGMMK